MKTDVGAAYIPMPKSRGFTPHFDKILLSSIHTRNLVTNRQLKSMNDKHRQITKFKNFCSFMCKRTLDSPTGNLYNKLMNAQLRYTLRKETWPVENPKYMTTSEFAERIGVHPQTLRKWDKNGTLKAHHKTPSGRRCYTEEQALEFLNETGMSENMPE